MKLIVVLILCIVSSNAYEEIEMETDENTEAAPEDQSFYRLFFEVMIEEGSTCERDKLVNEKERNGATKCVDTNFLPGDAALEPALQDMRRQLIEMGSTYACAVRIADMVTSDDLLNDQKYFGRIISSDKIPDQHKSDFKVAIDEAWHLGAIGTVYHIYYKATNQYVSYLNYFYSAMMKEYATCENEKLVTDKEKNDAKNYVETNYYSVNDALSPYDEKRKRMLIEIGSTYVCALRIANMVTSDYLLDEEKYFQRINNNANIPDEYKENFKVIMQLSWHQDVMAIIFTLYYYADRYISPQTFLMYFYAAMLKEFSACKKGKLVSENEKLEATKYVETHFYPVDTKLLPSNERRKRMLIEMGSTYACAARIAHIVTSDDKLDGDKYLERVNKLHGIDEGMKSNFKIAVDELKDLNVVNSIFHIAQKAGV